MIMCLRTRGNFPQACMAIVADTDPATEVVEPPETDLPGVSPHYAARIRYLKQQLLDIQAHVQDDSVAWSNILADRGPVFEELYSLKVSDDNSKRSRRRKNIDRRQRSSCRSEENAEKVWLEAAEDLEGLQNNVDSSSICSNIEPVDRHEFTSEEEDTTLEDSDDEGSLQPLAFYVEGQPDFDSGPPQDGYEYLRRVMWESAQCPKVKTARIDKRKLASEQTVYMPAIPPVPVCAHKLLPSKDWRRTFLAEFSDLRDALSNHMFPHVDIVEDLPPIHNKAIWKSFCFHRTDNSYNVLDKKVCGMTTMDMQNDTGACFTDEEAFTNSEVATHLPLLKMLLRLDEVSRSTLLRYHVSWLKEQNNLSYDRALWLFSLAAVVDTPLNDQTSAALRDLLRKCAELRMDKEPVDEELHMLNILITIAGDYFGQAEQS